MTELRALVRNLRRHRTSSLAAVGMMGCAIAVATTTFGLADAALWRALPYREADRLALLATTSPAGETRVALPDFLALRQGTHQARVAAAGAFTPEFGLTGFGEPRVLRARVLSADYFATLGVSLTAGRDFTQREETPGAGFVVILSNHLWRQLFEGRDALGESLSMNGRPYTVVGVLPPYRDFLGQVDLYVPSQFAPTLARRLRLFAPIARLDPSTDLKRFNADIRRLTAAPDDPDARDHHVMAVRLGGRVAESVRSRVVLLFAAAIGLLAIGMLNFTMLTAARARQREMEFAIRRALGASRATLLGLATMEAATLCVASASVALLASASVVPLVGSHLGLDLVNDVTMSRRVFAFALAVTVVAVTAALLAVRRTIDDQINPTRTVATSRLTGGRVLVVAQLSVTLVLLVSALLLGRSFAAQRHVDPGFAVADRLTSRIALPAISYPDPATRAMFWRTLLERLRSMGAGVAIATELPLTGEDNPTNFMARTPDGSETTLKVRSVSSTYFEVMEMPVRSGRGLALTDRADAPLVIVINERLAHHLAPFGPVVGQALSFDFGNGPQRATVVGVVPDVRHERLSVPAAREAYFHYEQTPLSTYSLVMPNVRAPSESARALRAALNTIDASRPFAPLVPFAERIERHLVDAQRQAQLFLLFAAAAAVVAAAGVYSLLSFLVSGTKREWAIRLALGATPGSLQRTVMATALRYASSGAVLGLFMFALGARLLSVQLYGVAVWDPVVAISSALLLATVCVVAAVIPARRVACISAAEVLRPE